MVVVEVATKEIVAVIITLFSPSLLPMFTLSTRRNTCDVVTWQRIKQCDELSHVTLLTPSIELERIKLVCNITR